MSNGDACEGHSPTKETKTDDDDLMLTISQRQLWQGGIAAFSYAASSVSIILLNKAILSPFGFNSPPFMGFVHMSCCLLFLITLKHVGWINYDDFNKQKFLERWPVALVFLGNILTGMWALKNVTVPIFTTLRRVTALMTIYLAWQVNGEIPSVRTTIPVLIMLFGAAIAGWGDLTFDAWGYFYTMLNNVFTAGYLVVSKATLKKLEEDQKDADIAVSAGIAVSADIEGGDLNGTLPPPLLPKSTSFGYGVFGLLFYNTLVATPTLFVVCLVSGTFQEVMQFEYIYDIKFQCAFLFSALLALFINFTTLWCNAVNSPLATSVTGQTKNILVTLIGGIIFSDTKPTTALIAGVLTSIFGSTLFAYEKYKEKMQERSRLREDPLAEEVPLISVEQPRTNGVHSHSVNRPVARTNTAELI